MNMDNLGIETLKYLVYHVFMPPQLPSRSDHSPARDQELCQILLDIATRFRATLKDTQLTAWKPIVPMLKNLSNLHDSNTLETAVLIKQFRYSRSGSILTIPIRAQNACVIIRRGPEFTIFEIFEVDPPNSQIMASVGKVARAFPDKAVKIPTSTFSSRYFQQELASFLAQMDSESLGNSSDNNKSNFKQRLPRAMDDDDDDDDDNGPDGGGSGGNVTPNNVPKERADTADPHYITKLFFAILRGFPGASAVSSNRDDNDNSNNNEDQNGADEVFSIMKRIENDIICAGDTTHLPWRRSSLWTIIRVTIHTSICFLMGSSHLYKLFMVYLTSQLLRLGVAHKLKSARLHCMRAKVARRLYKLKESNVPDEFSQKVLASIRFASECMEARWEKIQERNNNVDVSGAPRWMPETLNLERDTLLSLANSREYIKGCLSRRAVPPSRTAFSPTSYHRLPNTPSRPAFAAGKRALERAIKSNCFVALADIEQSVEAYLERWTKRRHQEFEQYKRTHGSANLDERRHNNNDDDDNNNDTITLIPTEVAATMLFTAIETYAAAAQTAYKDSPEDQSYMLLTIFDLWMALDRTALLHYDILRDYSPEVPLELLNPLLLRTSTALARYARIQTHIQTRHRNSLGRSVFSASDAVLADSFAVRYFDASPSLRLLKQEIESSARHEKRAKLRELEAQKAEYARLTERSDRLVHTYQPNARALSGQSHVKRKCKKCTFETQADGLAIEIFEWPLPAHDLKAREAVFELRVPRVFRVWREATYVVLYDFCRPGLEAKDVVQHKTLLSSYGGLSRHFRIDNETLAMVERGVGGASVAVRVTLASTPKSFTRNNIYGYGRRICGMSLARASPEDVAVENTMDYRLFDGVKSRWAGRSFDDCNFEPVCVMKLPEGSAYRYLQYAVAGVGHASNAVIAEQSKVPPEISLHEHIAFGSLRAGARIQWLNILRELHAQTLQLDKPEVQTLLLQAAWQVGELNQTLVWHHDLADPQFGELLLTEMSDVMTATQENWLHTVSLETVVRLIARLLACSTAAVDGRRSTAEVVSWAYELLRRARDIAYGWMTQLVDKLQDAVDDAAIVELQPHLCAAALVCRAAFDVDGDHLEAMMKEGGEEGEREDVAKFLECLVRIHDNVSLDSPPERLKRLLARDRRLSHRTNAVMSARIQKDRACLDRTISRLWSAYVSRSRWVFLASPSASTKTNTSSGSASPQPYQWVFTNVDADFAVHLDLLSGALLINGKPLNRLPQRITGSATYKRLFGQRVLDIVPSNMPNMEFSTRTKFQNTNVFVHFGEVNGQIIIQATDQQHAYELIPHTVLVDDFPHFLVSDHFHWLRHPSSPSSSNHVIEFRPLSAPWEFSDQNWLMRSSFFGKYYLEKSGECRLMDIYSPSFLMFAELPRPLERAQYMTMTVSNDQAVSVELPRHRLSFGLNDGGQLESYDLREMVVDDVNIGCLFGLQNRLILKPKSESRMHMARARCVLIPFGEVTYDILDYHAVVSVNTSDAPHIRHFKYDIDTNLGCLVAQSLEADLYKIYLHALTSNCLPDPLTGQTGTEEALAELSSAKCLSFQSLGTSERDLLLLIARLTPVREWYPGHLATMQMVRWNRLSFLCQHWAFFTLARRILEFAEKLTMFRPDESDMYTFAETKKYALNDHLRNRSALRGARLMSPDYAFINCAQEDRTYVPEQYRHGYQMSSPEEAARISALVHQWPTELQTIPDLWNKLFSCGTLRLEAPVISYESSLLEPNLGNIWGPFYEACISDSAQDAKRFAMSFSLAAIAYSSPKHEPLEFIPTLLSLATVPHFKTLDVPEWLDWSELQLYRGTTPGRDWLLRLTKDQVLPKENTPCGTMLRREGESRHEFNTRCQAVYDAACDTQAAEIVDKLMAQWTGESAYIEAPEPIQPRYINISEDYMRSVRERFLHWYRNLSFRRHIVEVQRVLDNSRNSLPSEPAPIEVLQEGDLTLDILEEPDHPLSEDSFSLQTIVELSDCPTWNLSPIVLPHIAQSQNQVSTTTLTRLTQQLAQREGKLHQLYAEALDKSRITLEAEIAGGPSAQTRATQIPQDAMKKLGIEYAFVSTDIPGPELLDRMVAYLVQAKDRFDAILNTIQEALSPVDTEESAVLEAGCWPRLTRRTMLQLLAHTNVGSAAMDKPGWKDAFVALAQLMVRLQQARRCVNWAAQNSLEELRKELQNQANEGDEVLLDPEWLLIQIEGNFMARPLQAKVAREMIKPSYDDNTLLQLNMGEGKTSVIVPFVAAHLADKSKLVRVVVLKPLKNQMFSALTSRLGGLLVNRRIFYLPFSRNIETTLENTSCLQSLFDLCKKEGGVFIVQPEHILSLKLMSVDVALDVKANEATAAKLLHQQDWLEKHSRDILDESDEILSVEYQLVYTKGQQAPLDYHPYRWLHVQDALELAKKHAIHLHLELPTGLEVQNSGSDRNSFPIIRILNDEAWKELSSAVADELVNSLKSDLRLCSVDMQELALGYITNLECPAEMEEHIRESLGTSLWTTLLLYRGLLAHGILRFALQQKRWRVDYGLDPSRTLLAVPYRAKDLPSPRADFGHPDVALILTCLSYYYGGLTEAQLELCFELLFKLDNPALEYNSWTHDHDHMPEGLRHITGVNWKDVQQRQKYLIPLFRRARTVVNFYLRHVVFPKEAKQFPSKLSTSAWDLSETSTHVKTGFSGTNDNHYLLPTTVHQRDPVNQLSTNAKVIAYLLQRENNYYESYGSHGERFSGRDFLALLTKKRPEVRVLLDVGAQMLDMRNDELVKHWLSICAPHIQAAVFVDDSNNLAIMTRDGDVTPFVSSPFSEKLDACIVYLDDAHTRGTDLKLPLNTRAAVTLGPDVTKDRLVQGCMRMRQLGHGQSVIFLAPPEIDKKIRVASGKDDSASISSAEVILWAMSETCDRILRYIGYWAHQGMSWKRRQAARPVKSEEGALGFDRTSLHASWVEAEARSLQEIYGAKTVSGMPHASQHIPELHSRLEEIGAISMAHSLMDEEQEREVHHEMEQQHQVERPRPADPARHSVHADVRELVKTGSFKRRSHAFLSPLSPISHLDAQIASWSPRILATADFCRTVEGGYDKVGDYMRPVNWIISIESKQNDESTVLILLSPHEANALLPQIRKSVHVHLHMYTPRTAESITSMEDLWFHSVPGLEDTWNQPAEKDITQLNLIAGQLYLQNYTAYDTLCQMLGIISGNIEKNAGPVFWDGDGFIRIEDREPGMAENCSFQKSPIRFIKTLTSLRRKGIDYRATHMGRILNREALTIEDFPPDDEEEEEEEEDAHARDEVVGLD